MEDARFQSARSHFEIFVYFGVCTGFDRNPNDFDLPCPNMTPNNVLMLFGA